MTFLYNMSLIPSSIHHMRIIHNPKCTPAASDDFPRDIFSQETRQHGAILLHVLAVLYTFGALVYICTIYYVPCLESITKRFGIDFNVAGATIVAIAGSACELVITMFGTFVSKTDVGLGTVVGSASFSILLGLGICAVLAPEGLTSKWYPVIRESVFYLLSLVIVGLLTVKQEVKWYEALTMITCYVAYIILVWLSQCCDRDCRCDCKEVRRYGDVQEEIEEDISLMYFTPEKINEYLKNNNDLQSIIDKSNKLPNEYLTKDFDEVVETNNCRGDKFILDDLIKRYEEERKVIEGDKSIEKEDAEEEFESICSSLKDTIKPPTYNFMFVLWLLGFPIILLFAISIPKHRDTNSTSTLFITFIMTLLYIGGLSYFLLWMITVISLTFLIQDIVFGLVILAAAGCAPDIITSAILAQHGLGDMCISSILGNCIFDLFIGLGLPWFLKAVTFGSPIEIMSGSIKYSIMILTVSVVCLVGSLVLNGFSIGKRSGILLILAYLVIISVICLMELDVIGHFNYIKC